MVPVRVSSTLLTLALLGCGGESDPQEAAPSEVEASVAGDGDLGVCPEIRHARHFRIRCEGSLRIVETFGEVAAFQTGRDAEEVRDLIVLVPRGTPSPPLTTELAGAQIIEVPVLDYAVNNDDILALTLELGVADQLVAVGGPAVYDDGVRARVDRGELGEVGYSWHLPPDQAVLLERDPDVTFMAMDSPHNVPALERSRALGLVVAPAFVWAERDVLARAEWSLFFSLFFGLEEEAVQRFDEIEARYSELRDRVAESVSPPSALWAYHAGNDRWFAMTNNLEARLLRDAGVNNLFADLDSDSPVRADGDPISSEQILIEGASAEHWIVGDIHQAELPSDDFMASFVAWNEERLYHNYGRTNWDVNAYDWYEGATGKPDVLLADLVHLFHRELLPDHELQYFGRFDREAGR